MKRYLFSRVFGIFLAGILLVDSSIPVFAAETGNETPQQVEIIQEAESEEAEEVEIVEEKEGIAELESWEVKTSESKEPEESQVVETTQVEESSEAAESTTIEMSTEMVEASTEEVTGEESSVEEEWTIETESTEEASEVMTSEAVEEVTEEETETTTEEMTEELPEMMFFTLSKPTTAPSSVSVVERTATTATILWKTIDGYTEYQVYRSNNADTGFTLLEGATIETTSNVGAFLDTSCESGKVYYYKICAVVTSDGEVVEQGPFSEVVNNSVVLQQITLSESKIAMHKGEESVLSVIYAPSFAAGMHSVTWSSDNSEVATVKDGKVTAAGAGTAIITAAAGEKTATCEVTVTVPLEQLVIDKEEVELTKGKSVAVSASFKPEDTTDEVTLTWSSSDENVATVVQNEENGKTAEITAVGAGTAVITVSAGDVTAECQVKVTVPATDVELSDNTIQLLEADDSVNVTISITPMNTTDEVSYVVDDPELIDCEMGDRVLTIKSLGVLGATQVHITVGNKTAVLNVQIVEEKQTSNITSDIIPVSDITIEAEWNEKEDEEIVKGAINLWLGEDTYSKATVTAKVSPVNATNQEIEWTSSNESVVTVDENGIVTAVGVGRASVIATADNGVTEAITVIVVPASGSFKITSGEKVTLYCNDGLSNVDNAARTHQVLLSKEIVCEYRSSNETVATVDKQGLITAHNPGSAVISVVGKANGEVKTVQVTVKRIVENIELPLEEITVIKGTKPEIAFTAFPKNTSVESLNTIYVKTEKTNSDIITIDKNWTKGKTSGTIKFTANKAGDETIIITAGDIYYDEENEKISVISVRKEILVHVVDTQDVQDVKATSIKISGVSKMKSATEQTLGITVKDKSGNELDISLLTIGFSSSNTEVATVDKNGNVTALKGGTSTITAYVMDGSNIKANYTITVEQRPEEIVFDRPVYGVSKAANSTAAVAVLPRFIPAATVNKAVTWRVEQVMNPDGTVVEGSVTDYFTVDSNGRVTAKKTATDGMRAIVTCTSKAYDADEEQVVGTVTVEVQAKKVTAVKFTKSNVEAVGLEEHSIPFTTTFAKGYSEAVYEAYTSDEEIATVTAVKDGQVILKAHKYGTVTVTLCADRAVTATCKVTVYPVARGSLAAKEAAYLLQQAQYDGNDKVQLYFVDSKTKKIIVDPALFTYQSSNPDIVYVDENGIAYANAVSDGKITTSNNQITVTATLKDDPDKRKVTTKVIVCPTEQIERMDVSYYPTVGKAAADKYNTDGTILTDNGTSMVYSGGSQNFVLRVISFGADNEKIINPQLKFTSSDTTLATIASQSKKTITADEEQYEFWEVVINVKQAGRFSIQVAAQDQKQYTRSINFAAYCAKPILVSKDLGTINRNAEVVVTNITEDTAIEGIPSDKGFTLLGGDGTEIKEVSVESAKVKMKASNKIETIPTGKFTVMKIGSNEYRLVMLASEVSKVVDGTYSITLEIKRTLLGNEGTTPDYGSNETTTEKINTTFTIISTLPNLSAAKITLNSFIKGDAVKIPINTTENVESVTIASGMMLAKELDVFKQGKDWYAKIKDEAFNSWKKTSTSGVLYVKVEGYETPIAMNLNVTCRETKPAVRQLEIPSIQLQHGADTYVTLVDAQKQIWEDYTVTRKSSSTAPVFTVESENDKTKVTFVDTSMKLRGQGVTLTEKVLVSKEEWRSPIEMSISVKAYNGVSVPTVGFVNSTLNINKTVGESTAETGVKISHSNVTLTEGEWKISDNCKYNTVENKKTVSHHASEAFKVEYEDGTVKVSLRNEDVPNGTYRLTMTNLWDASLDANLKSPLTTSILTVVVKEAKPVVAVKMSGQLDLIKRSQSTLTGTITVSNMNSIVKRVRLINNNNDGFADRFYCTRRDNTFTIYARSSAVLTTTRITGNIEITMSDGNVLYQTINFTPTQSVPSVITPANEAIYKSATVKTVDFNFNENLTDGVRISDIKVTSLPAGLKVQDSNGHLFVTLGDKTLKQGKYKLVVNVYFKGAQAISGDTQGKAVSKTIYVEVKE